MDDNTWADKSLTVTTYRKYLRCDVGTYKKGCGDDAIVDYDDAREPTEHARHLVPLGI